MGVAGGNGACQVGMSGQVGVAGGSGRWKWRLPGGNGRFEARRLVGTQGMPAPDPVHVPLRGDSEDGGPGKAELGAGAAPPRMFGRMDVSFGMLPNAEPALSRSTSSASLHWP